MARIPVLPLLLLLSSFRSFVCADLLAAADLPKLVSRHKLGEGEAVTVQTAKLHLRQADDGISASTTSAAAAFIPAQTSPVSTPLFISTPAIVQSSPAVVISTTSAVVEPSSPAVVISTTPAVVQQSSPVAVVSTPAIVDQSSPAVVISTPAIIEQSSTLGETSSPVLVEPSSTPVGVSTTATIEPSSTSQFVVIPTLSTLFQSSDPPIVQPTDSGIIQPTDPGVVQPTDPGVVQPTDPSVVPPTPTPVHSDSLASPITTLPPSPGTLPPSGTPQSSGHPSSCEPSLVTECTVDVFESTTLFVSGGSTQTSVTTSSSTACQTSTICDAAGCTATTTIAKVVTTTAAEFTCDVDTCANNQCPAQTGSAKLRKQKRAIEEYEALYGYSKDGTGVQRFGKRYLKALSTLTKRALPAVTNGDTYNIGVCNQQPTRELDWGFTDNPAITQWGEWPSNGAAWWMAGLEGCTGIIVTSSRGYWMVHITEPGFMSDGSEGDKRTKIWNDALNNLQNGHTGGNPALDADTKAPGTLTGARDILELSCDNDVRVWTMSPGTADDYDFDTDTDIPGQAIYPDKLRELLDTLVNNQGAPLNGARIMDNKIYQKTKSDLTSNGRMMVEFDPHGIEGGTDQPTYRVWAEDQNIGTWPDQGSTNKKRQACSNKAPQSTTHAPAPPASTSIQPSPPVQTTSAAPSIDCNFAARRVTDWYEGGAQRYRIAYSGPSPMADLGGSPPSASTSLQDAAGYWWNQANADCAGVEQNMQNYWSSGDSSLVIDDSEVLGIAGSNVIDCTVDKFVGFLKTTAGCDR